MKSDINLINKEVQKTINLLKLRKKIRVLVISLVGVFIFFSSLVLFAFLFVKQSYKGNESKIASLKSQLKSLEKNESYALVIADRLRGINVVLKQRKSFLSTVADIETLSVPGLKVEGLNLDDRGNLKITGTCENQEVLSEFNNRVEQISLAKKYSQIIYPSVNRTRSGQYYVIVELKQ